MHSVNSLPEIANYSATAYVYTYQPQVTPTISSSTSSLPNTPDSAPFVTASATTAPTGHGFFANKGAVAVTFAIVGAIVFFAVLVGALFLFKRLRERRERKEVDEFFEKYSGDYSGGYAMGTTGTNYSPLGRASPMEQTLTAAAGPDAYPDRSVHNGSRPQSGVILPPSVNFGVLPFANGAHGSFRSSVASSVRHPSPLVNSTNVSYTAVAPSSPGPAPTPAPDPHNRNNTAGLSAGPDFNPYAHAQ